MFKKLTLFLAIVVTSSLNVSGERTISQTPVSSLDTNELWIWDNSHSLLSHRAMITPLLLWSRIKQLKIQQITVSVPTCSTFYNFLVRIKHITFERDGHSDWISCNNLVWFLLPCSYSWHGLCRQTLQHPHLHFTTLSKRTFNNIVSTNQKRVLICFNQSEESIDMYQPITVEYCFVTFNSSNFSRAKYSLQTRE